VMGDASESYDPDSVFRTHDQAGRQIVDCEGYAYAWPNTDEPLNLGDRVMLPGNYVDPNPRESTVTALGSTYPGDLVMVLRKLHITSGLLRPRKYQFECITALRQDWDQGIQRLAVVLPTGMGKTVIMAHLIKGDADAGNIVGVIVPRDELVTQTIAKVHSVAPHLTIGVVKARRNEWQDVDVVIMSAQTLARENRLHAIPRHHFGLIIVDECHHAAAASYQTALRWFGVLPPTDQASWDLAIAQEMSDGDHDTRSSALIAALSSTRLAGFTATLTRQDKLGLGDVFQKVSYTKDILYGIRHGYLVDPKPKSVHLDTDLDEDTTRAAGDFTAGSLGKALLKAEAPTAMLHAIQTETPDRQGIVFWPTVETADTFARLCNTHGVSCELIIGDTPAEDRELTFKRIRSGETQVLSNVMVGTEGLDVPQFSFVGIGRPTTNTGLLTQMIGRGLRPWAGQLPNSPYSWMTAPKTDCMVLLLDASTNLKLATLADLSTTIVREINDGEGLVEAIDRQEHEDAEREKRRLDTSRLRIVDLDLFGRSSSAWLQTRRGYWFIPTKDWLIAMYPEDTTGQTFMVGRVSLTGSSRAAGHTIGRQMTQGYAMAWAESEAAEIDPSISSRTAAWRKKKKEPASSKQIDFARSLGVKAPEQYTKTELSDQISIVIASRRLDRYTPATPTHHGAGVDARH
jgi:superfamily II DNA or RNA helicase